VYIPFPNKSPKTAVCHGASIVDIDTDLLPIQTQ